MSAFKATIMDDMAIARALKRISHELLEKNNGCENVCLVGIKRRGFPIAEQIAKNILQIENVSLPLGALDITFYRDDLDTVSSEPVAKTPELPFDVNGKNIVLVDDVLYTGRTARAAMDAIMSIGRPASIQLAVLIDRGHRELPIRGDFVGKNVPTSKLERISVKMPPFDEITAVELLTK